MNGPRRPPPEERPQHRKVTLFVAAHVAAVAGLYGLALAVGGGWAPPPFPPDVLASSRVPGAASHRAPVDGAAHAATHADARTAEHSGEGGPHAHRQAPWAATASTLPAWAQSAEARAPWEGH